MRYFYFICFLLVISALRVNAQSYEKSCFYGFTFEVSKNPNWGDGELVITAVEPSSAAEKAGIKVGDIVTEINGKATYLRDNQTIAKWLFDVDVHDPVYFTIRNMNTDSKKYPLHRNCINLNSINERELSTIFSFYSLEDTNQQTFTIPAKTTPNPKVNFADYHSFNFYLGGTQPSNLDKRIMAILETELIKKGLVKDTKEPDIIVQIYYGYESNPKYTATSNNMSRGAWRYDCSKQNMAYLPVIDKKETAIDAKAQYIAEFGVTFFDQKYIDKEKMTEIWDCNIKDYLATQYSFDEYIRIHAPLMLMQFPYSTKREEVKYTVEFNKYNYTGMHFDIEDMVTVKDVDTNSPAYAAGIRPGYVVKRIGNKRFDHNKATLSGGYKRFIAETMVLRDQSTRFTDAQGYADCMFWSGNEYANVVKEFNKPQHYAGFSYLYSFAKYVNNNPGNSISVEAWEGAQKHTFEVEGQTRQSVIVKTK